MGQFDAARRTLLAVLSLFDATNNHPGKLVTTLLLGEVCSESGALHQAAELYRKALIRAGETGENLADRAKALIGLAQLSYEWNNLERAEQLAQEALDLNGWSRSPRSRDTHGSGLESLCAAVDP